MKECNNWTEFKNSVKNGDFVRLGYAPDMIEKIREKQKKCPSIFGIRSFYDQLKGIVNHINEKSFQLNSYESRNPFSVIIDWKDVEYAIIETDNLKLKIAGLQRYTTIEGKYDDSARKMYELGSTLQINLLNSDSVCGILKVAGEKYIVIEELNNKCHMINRNQIRSIWTFPFPTGTVYVPEGAPFLPIEKAEAYEQQLVMMIPAQKIGIVSYPEFGILTSVGEKVVELVNPDTGYSKSCSKCDFVRIYKL